MLNDSLSLLDQRNALSTLNLNLIQTLLNQSLPKTITWKLIITEYQFENNVISRFIYSSRSTLTEPGRLYGFTMDYFFSRINVISI